MGLGIIHGGKVADIVKLVGVDPEDRTVVHDLHLESVFRTAGGRDRSFDQSLRLDAVGKFAGLDEVGDGFTGFPIEEIRDLRMVFEDFRQFFEGLWG